MDTEKKDFWTYQKVEWLSKDLRSLAINLFLKNTDYSSEFMSDMNFLIMAKNVVDKYRSKGYFATEKSNIPEVPKIVY